MSISAKQLIWLWESGKSERLASTLLITPISLTKSSKKAFFCHLLHGGKEKVSKRDTTNRRGKQKVLQNVEEEALAETFPLVHVWTLHAAAGGMAETTAERLGNLPLEGREGEPRINLEGIEGTQTQMFWRITPCLCGPLENDLSRECINNLAAVISNRATTLSVQRGKEKPSYLKRRARKDVDCPPGHSPSARDPHLLRFLQ